MSSQRNKNTHEIHTVNPTTSPFVYECNEDNMQELLTQIASFKTLEIFETKSGRER